MIRWRVVSLRLPAKHPQLPEVAWSVGIAVMFLIIYIYILW